MRSLYPLLGVRDKIPLGLSRRPTSTSRCDCGMDRFLVVPLLPWFGRRYEINVDTHAKGWWLGRLMLMVRVGSFKPGFELHVRWGCVPIRVTYEETPFVGWPL